MNKKMIGIFLSMLLTISYFGCITNVNAEIANSEKHQMISDNNPNNPPQFGTPSPSNDSTLNLLSLNWSIQINDPEGDTFTWTVECSNNQDCSGIDASNGTKYIHLWGLKNLTLYKVWVNASDPTGSGLYTCRWYTFTTKVKYNTTFIFMTFGPRDSTISEITFQNGTFQNKSLRLLNIMFTIGLRLTFLLFPLTRPIGFFALDKIDFIVEYKKDLPRKLFTRDGYMTMIDEWVDRNSTNNVITILNEKHTLKVEGFHGFLVLFKRSMVMSPSFEIIGECNRYTLIQ